MDEIKHICIVGAGNMGQQIALCAAIAGFQVTCFDVKAEVLTAAQAFAEAYLAQRVAKERLTQQQADAAGQRLCFEGDMACAVRETDLVIEAATERLELKRAIFTQLDQLAPPHAILATNSSFIVSSRLADATRRPGKVCNMHFFNPALVMKLVEVVKGPHTTEETALACYGVAQRMGKEPVLLQKEVYGFLVNSILHAINQQAFLLADMGVATPQEIDKAVENGLNHPMGPFRLMDFTGIDMNYYQRLERYQETQCADDRPWPLLVEKWAKGEWGKKTKRGFYDYE